jgi:hypothetical protein
MGLFSHDDEKKEDEQVAPAADQSAAQAPLGGSDASAAPVAGSEPSVTGGGDAGLGSDPTAPPADGGVAGGNDVTPGVTPNDGVPTQPPVPPVTADGAGAPTDPATGAGDDEANGPTVG